MTITIITEMRSNKGFNRPTSRHLPVPSKHPKPLQKAYFLLIGAQESEEIPYQINLFLRRMAAKGPEGISKCALHGKIVTVVREIRLNELEVAVWSLYLEKFVWDMKAEELDKGLYIAGIATKAYFDENGSLFRDYLETIWPGIQREYEEFRLEHADQLDISPKDLHFRFSQLSFCPFQRVSTPAADYNELTDALLALAPPQAKAKPILPQDDRGSGGTAPSCSESEHIQDWELPLDYWDTPKLTSLAEIWPDLTTK